MYAAKDAGRDRVLPAGWSAEHGEGPRMVDVLVVEDDPAIARLLQHALETRGLRHEWISNGEQAARLLTDLRSRYVLGFKPAAFDDQVHSIGVHVRRPGLVVRTRAAYRAPK